MWSLVYILSTRVNLCFAVHNLEKFSSNPGKVYVAGLLHLLRYIKDNNYLGLQYYSKMENAFLSDLLIQDSIELITNLWCSLVPAGRTSHILSEVQEHKLCFIKVDQFIIAHMFQVLLLNLLLIANKI